MAKQTSASRRRRNVSNRFQYKASDRIGYADARNDASFLDHCYLEKGHVHRALDTTNPGTILIGRTGSGKTAGLMFIRQTTNNCVEISPADLSLEFIAGSDILSFLHNLDVDLDLLFQLLWRHILCVELIKLHYERTERSQKRTAWDRIKSAVSSDRAKKTALEYLEEWGSSFWEETQERIREVVQGFERKLETAVKAKLPKIEITGDAAYDLHAEEKAEVVRIAQDVVSKVQIRKLNDLMTVMEEDIFKNRQARYYVVIDGLDEQWVADSLRYRLIRALIEAVKSFRDMRMVKVIIALRLDLIEYVYDMTRSKGFQREKYEDLHIRIEWNREELFQLVNLRISELQKQKGDTRAKGFQTIFPERYRGKQDTFDYLLARTQMRPRDLIEFINIIIRVAAGKTSISVADISAAEEEHSRSRLRALFEEWELEHPHLESFAQVLRDLPTRFPLGDLSDDRLHAVVGKLLEADDSEDPMCKLATRFLEDDIDLAFLRREVVYVLFKTGLVGIRPASSYERVRFSYHGGESFKKEDITAQDEVVVSPMLWQAFKNQDVAGQGDSFLLPDEH